MKFTELPREVEEQFPAHGWVAGKTGVRHLRLPVLRLYSATPPTAATYAEAGLNGAWLQSRSPYRTVHQLAIALRDLHALARQVLLAMDAGWDKDASESDRSAALSFQLESNGRIEILLIAAFVLLRRLPDVLIDASRPLLFENWENAPRTLKAAKAKNADGTLRLAKPRDDLTILESALRYQTDWFEQLRNEEGVRDILVHKDHVLQINATGTQRQGDAKFAWRLVGSLTRWRGDGTCTTIDMFPRLIECIDGACAFMSSLYQCIAPLDGYDRNDVLFLTGEDNDIAGFWPPIKGARPGFPLMA